MSVISSAGMRMARLMYLIDTDIISELRKGKQANRGAIEFLYDTKANKRDCYLSVVTIGELRRGMEMVRHRGDIKQADALHKWFLMITNEYSDKILPIDHEVAAIWADLRVPHHENVIDNFIAATALLHSLQVVTRNIKDVEKTGVPVVNPYR